MVPALLKWIGNKQRFADTIVSYMPSSFNNYYEPFLGSGAVLAELLMQDATSMFPHFEHAYGSDVLPFLIDIFRSVKDNPSELADYYAKEISAYYDNPEVQYEVIKIASIKATMPMIFVCYQEPAIRALFDFERLMDI